MAERGRILSRRHRDMEGEGRKYEFRREKEGIGNHEMHEKHEMVINSSGEYEDGLILCGLVTL